MSIGHNAGGIIPKGMEIDFTEAAKGTQQPFEYMVSLMEKTVSKAILGGTLTSQADGKSSTNALGNVHNEVREELRNSDLKQIANTLSRDLVFPMYAKNCTSFYSSNRQPKFEFDITEAEDLTAFSESLPNLVDIGFQIPVDWAQSKVQIPKPKDGEAVLGRPQPTALTKESESKITSKDKVSTLKKITALKAMANNTKPEELDNFTTQLSNNMTDSLNSFTSEVQTLVDQATSLDELSTLLASLDLNVDEASEIMQQAFMASELSGMYDVEQESE
jgi:phage gp29-like protein